MSKVKIYQFLIEMFFETPCLIIAGENDEFHEGAKRGSEALPNTEFLSLKGLDHIQAFGETSAIVTHITRFLRKR
jgi:hypothetical protein